MAADDRFGVLLTEQGWTDLATAVAPYKKHGPIGDYLYCRDFVIDHPFANLTIVAAQLPGLIGEMIVRIPLHYVMYVAGGGGAGANAIPFGFVPPAL